MATYTLTVKNRVNAKYGNTVEYGSNYTAVPSGDSVQTLESGTYLYVETLGDLYIDGVKNSDGWWEGYLNADMLIEFDGEDGYITTKYSGDGGDSVGDHNAFIDGTAMAIEGGRDMVGGTMYEIAEGTTLVNGTAYVIVFSSPFTVNITGSGNTNYCYVTINGTKYLNIKTIECEAGTEISILASSSSAKGKMNSKISLNGAQVASGSSNGSTSSGASYQFVPDAEAVEIYLDYTSSRSLVTITTS